MSRIVNCVVLKREAAGLDSPPHPGPLGVRIYENVSSRITSYNVCYTKLLREVPPALDELIMQLLAKRAEDRPASAAILLERLQALA